MTNFLGNLTLFSLLLLTRLKKIVTMATTWAAMMAVTMATWAATIPSTKMHLPPVWTSNLVLPVWAKPQLMHREYSVLFRQYLQIKCVKSSSFGFFFALQFLPFFFAV